MHYQGSIKAGRDAVYYLLRQLEAAYGGPVPVTTLLLVLAYVDAAAALGAEERLCCDEVPQSEGLAALKGELALLLDRFAGGALLSCSGLAVRLGPNQPRRLTEPELLASWLARVEEALAFLPLHNQPRLASYAGYAWVLAGWRSSGPVRLAQVLPLMYRELAAVPGVAPLSDRQALQAIGENVCRKIAR